MRKKIRHNEVQNGQLREVQTNCNRCALKREDLCPYLETIVNCHLFSDLKSRKVLDGFRNERRQYPRIITSIPAFISNGRSREEKLRIGSIIDISLGGLRISIPRGMEHTVLNGLQATEFEIITKLPNGNKPIQLKCKSKRAIYSKDNIHVGASVIDAASRSYKAFKSYLI